MIEQERFNKELKRHQDFARQLNGQVASLIRNDERLSGLVVMMLWHGSLPLGKGGNAYDIDYAVFLSSTKPLELMHDAEIFSSEIPNRIEIVSWRNDLHYDGMKMFETHTHWDPVESNLPHIGVHLYRKDALYELLENRSWCSNQRPKAPFFFLLDLWRRYCFFYRHWIYEGVRIYDPLSYYSKIKRNGFSPPDWLITELYGVLRCIFQGYRTSNEAVCTVLESRILALDLSALMAYAIEDVPIGRSTRYISDMGDFVHESAKSLLKAVIDRNVIAAANAIEIYPLPME